MMQEFCELGNFNAIYPATQATPAAELASLPLPSEVITPELPGTPTQSRAPIKKLDAPPTPKPVVPLPWLAISPQSLETVHFVNHACEPNAALLFTEMDWVLKFLVCLEGNTAALIEIVNKLGVPHVKPQAAAVYRKAVGGDPPKQFVVLVVTRPIPKGEEVTIDYVQLGGIPGLETPVKHGGRVEEIDPLNPTRFVKKRSNPSCLWGFTQMDCQCAMVESIGGHQIQGDADDVKESSSQGGVDATSPRRQFFNYKQSLMTKMVTTIMSTDSSAAACAPAGAD